MICFTYTYKLNTQRQISYEAKKKKEKKKKKKPPNSLNVRCPPPFSTVGDESVVQHPIVEDEIIPSFIYPRPEGVALW